MARMARISVLAICGVLGIVAVTSAQRTAPPFTPADQLRVAREVCGASVRGTARDGIGTVAETLTGFLAEDKGTFFADLLSETIVQDGVHKHASVFGAHVVIDGEISSNQAAQTTVCAAWLEHRGGRWVPVASEPALTDAGFNGRDPDVELAKIGVDRHALRITSGAWNAGSAISFVSLYEPRGKAFAELLSAATSADDCGGGEPCFRFDGDLVFDTASRTDAYDIQLRVRGTYRGDRGRVVRIPRAPLVLRLIDGVYVPVSRGAGTQALWTALQQPWQ